MAAAKLTNFKGQLAVSTPRNIHFIFRHSLHKPYTLSAVRVDVVLLAASAYFSVSLRVALRQVELETAA